MQRDGSDATRPVRILSVGTDAQRRPDVGLLPREQAVADLPVGGQPDAVTTAAERPADTRDDADRRRSAIDEKLLGRCRPAFGDRRQLVLARQHRLDLGRRHHDGAVPAVLRVEWHLLDEPKRQVAIEAVVQQVKCFVVVDAAHQHGVDLHGHQAERQSTVQAGEHVVEPVSARERHEGFPIQRVQTHIDAVQPRAGQCFDNLREADAVGGHGQLGTRTEVGEPSYQIHQTAAQQRLTSGEPDLGDAEVADRDADDTDDLVVREHLGSGHPVQALGRHAVGAAEVALVRQRHAQVAVHASEAVDECTHAFDPTPTGQKVTAASANAFRRGDVACVGLRPGAREAVRRRAGCYPAARAPR